MRAKINSGQLYIEVKCTKCKTINKIESVQQQSERQDSLKLSVAVG